MTTTQSTDYNIIVMSDPQPWRLDSDNNDPTRSILLGNHRKKALETVFKHYTVKNLLLLAL